MKLSFQFANQCGTVYRCGNIAFTADGNSLLSPVGNRVTVFDLVEHTSSTLPVENNKNIDRICLSPDSRLLLTIDEDGRALVINLKRRMVLHRFNFKSRVRAAEFSPCGQYIALSQDRKLQVWRAPGLRREFAPFVRHRVYTGHFDDVVSVDWSADSRYLVTGSKDMTARVYSRDPVAGFVPVTLSGHRAPVVNAWFAGDDEIYTVARDAAVFVWKWTERADLAIELDASSDEEGADGAGAGAGGGARTATSARRTRERHAVPAPSSAAATSALKARGEGGVGDLSVLRGEWTLQAKHFFKQDQATVHAAALHKPSSLLVVGFSSGVFGLYEMPTCTNVHTLSISQRRINTVAINSTGEWLAFGSATLGQLLVWEWQSETYVLKQQGHAYGLNSLAYSPDGQMLVTGGDDGKVKVWNTTSGFCFVTFTEHKAPVNALAFVGGGTTGHGHAVLSASADGTVRAFDLVRYRNFRTLTTPTPVQFLSLAADPSGEVVCAGAVDPFDIYVWSLQTGKLLDVLSGHEGPVSSLAFSPTTPFLASGSWDHTVKVWDVFKKATATETFTANSDVLAVAFRPDGKQLCSSARDGNIAFWNVARSTQEGVIEGRRDAVGGRRLKDRRTAKSSAAAKCFTSVAYSADGSCILAGGRTKYVCIYAVEPRLLLRKFQLSHNKSLDGMLDKLNSKSMTAFGAVEEADVSGSDEEKAPDETLPGVTRGDLSSRKTRPEIRSTCVRFSPTGRAFSAATTEGLMVFTLDESLTFDPFDLDENVTPAAAAKASADGQHTKAVIMALHLNETDVIERALAATPVDAVDPVAEAVPFTFLRRLLDILADRIASSPHLELYLRWSLAVMQHHGRALTERTSVLMPSLRAVQKAITAHSDAIGRICDGNTYMLEFLGAMADPRAAASGGAGGAGGAAAAASDDIAEE
mmetsp:Transcript_6250/g.22223  ORF Transcript_6250/g.22223 Transcript_6250/m.22223 type:complete len:926 (-) Transcript_6250:29-2806(-)